MELWIFTPYNHVQCGALDEYEELNITHKAVKEGEIHFVSPLTDISKLIVTDSLIWPKGDDTGYIVTTCQKQKNNQGKEIVIVNGACLKCLLDMRTCKKTKVYEGKTGYVMRKMLDDVFAEEKRKFPRFTYSIDATIGEDISIETGNESLLELFEDLCEASGLTMRITFNPQTRAMVLKVEKGLDRTIGNGTNGVVQFDDTQETIANVEYTESIRDEKNVMYIEDGEGVVLEVGTTMGSGFRRREDGMKATSSKTMQNDDGTTTELTSAQYAANKRTEARKELEKKKKTESIEGETEIENALLAYGKDYTLGDIVTAKKEAWGIGLDVRVTEETEKHKNGNITRKLTLGSPLPTLAERIKMR